MNQAEVSLDDKYALECGLAYMSGIQALVRLPMLQQVRDRAAGLDTAGFVSGYRGSPLGSLDKSLWQARDHLQRHDVHFLPGINEDLAATAVWGTQQVNLFPGAKHDGVYAMWYGKGPGVDRSGDVFKHANAAGTSRHGGVLVLAGDDHACKSSTLPHQSDYAFTDAMIPVLNPSSVQEVLDLGLIGWAMSRYSGCWIGFKTITETVDASAVVDIDPERVKLVLPGDHALPDAGLHIRWPDPPLSQEARLHRHKVYAALAFARANRLDRTVLDSPQPRVGIVTTGKSYLDTLQALEDLGVDQALAEQIGLRLYKVAMPWPLEPEGIREFAEGLEEIVVIEEKRAVIENQLKEQLYNWDERIRPRVVGKFDEGRDWLLPSMGELTPAMIARVIAARIAPFHDSMVIREHLAFLEQKEAALARPRLNVDRVPHYCSGCPHNTSTVVPEGSRAQGGIGCHYMVTWMDRDTETFSQMGGEGVTWIGQAQFTETAHIFQNLGDGTYYHSGSLAIRAAIAAKVNITYQLLFNDAVAMTGGQPVDGPISVRSILDQLAGEGVERFAIVSDTPKLYADFSARRGVTVHDRSELDAVQRTLREVPGVSLLLYAQTCATEMRRRRKRGLLEDPAKRAFINSAICEGCGDCSTQSNCLSVIPEPTPLGRKRAIDQSACNKDFRCVDGLCPSFVTVHGGGVRKPAASNRLDEIPLPPEPARRALETPARIVIAGIGGTGVVTISALLGMAARLDGRACSVLDQTGLAQKYGAVISHVQIGDDASRIHSPRVAAGDADLLIGCDLGVAAGYEPIAKLRLGRARAVVNLHESMPAAFTRNPDLAYPTDDMQATLIEAVGEERVEFVAATRLATTLLGDSIGGYLFLVGFALQRGGIPLSAASIERAIELNGVAVEGNVRAFRLGRRAAVDLDAVEALAGAPREVMPEGLEPLIALHREHLTGYQDSTLADRFERLVRRVEVTEGAIVPAGTVLAEAVARGYGKLLAYKDEYEVARLYSTEAFATQLRDTFDGDFKLRIHLAPPLLARKERQSGRPRKIAFGPWILPLMRVLAHGKQLRGRWFDPFGHTAERRSERALIGEYEALVARLLAGLDADTHDAAVEIASTVEQIRGFGLVKARNLEQVRARQSALLNAYPKAG